MSLCDLEYVVPKLESLSDPDKNRIEIHRDRVGNWRVIIDEHFTDLYVEGRNEDLAVAMQQAIESYNSWTTKDQCP